MCVIRSALAHIPIHNVDVNMFCVCTQSSIQMFRWQVHTTCSMLMIMTTVDRFIFKRTVLYFLAEKFQNKLRSFFRECMSSMGQSMLGHFVFGREMSIMQIKLLQRMCGTRNLLAIILPTSKSQRALLILFVVI